MAFRHTEDEGSYTYLMCKIFQKCDSLYTQDLFVVIVVLYITGLVLLSYPRRADTQCFFPFILYHSYWINWLYFHHPFYLLSLTEPLFIVSVLQFQTFNYRYFLLLSLYFTWTFLWSTWIILTSLLSKRKNYYWLTYLHGWVILVSSLLLW